MAIFLSALVALILVRTLRKDLMRYNRIPTDEEKAEELEESGWKLVHGDVFRPPAWPLVFSVMVGSGVQCFWMSFATIGFAAFGSVVVVVVCCCCLLLSSNSISIYDSQL